TARPIGSAHRHERRCRRSEIRPSRPAVFEPARPEATVSWRIREATAADVPTVLRFVVELAGFERLAHEVELDGAEARLREHLFGERPRCEVLLAEEDGAALGFALFFPTYSTFKTAPCLHLEDLYVAPAARGRGIGEGLLRAVARRARERGCARLQWNVLDCNRRAIAFYERMGASVLADWRTGRVEGEASLRALADS